LWTIRGKFKMIYCIYDERYFGTVLLVEKKLSFGTILSYYFGKEESYLFYEKNGRL